MANKPLDNSQGHYTFSEGKSKEEPLKENMSNQDSHLMNSFQKMNLYDSSQVRQKAKQLINSNKKVEKSDCTPQKIKNMMIKNDNMRTNKRPIQDQTRLQTPKKKHTIPSLLYFERIERYDRQQNRKIKDIK